MTAGEIPVQVELGGTATIADRLELADATAAVTTDLDRLRQDLGVPGSVVVEVVPVEARRDLRVRVHRGLLRHPAEAAWESDDGPQIDRLGRLVRTVVPAVVRRRPGCLIGPDQAALYATHSDDPPPTDLLARVLAALLDLGVSVANKPAVLQAVRLGQELGRSADDTVEAVYCRLRTAVVEVRTRAPLGTEAAELVASVGETLGLPMPRPSISLAPELDADLVAVRVNDVAREIRAAPWNLGPAALQELRQVACRLLGVEETLYLLGEIELREPTLVEEVLAGFPVAALTRLLRSLLAEGVSIRNPYVVLERLVQFDTVPLVLPPHHLVLDNRLPLAHGRTASERDRLAFIRGGLRWEITEAVLGDRPVLVAIRPDREVEQLAEAAGGAPLVLEEAVADAILDRLRMEVEQALVEAPEVVILTTLPARAAIRELTAEELPRVPVVAAEELRADVDVRRYGPGQVTLGSPAEAVVAD